MARSAPLAAAQASTRAAPSAHAAAPATRALAAIAATAALAALSPTLTRLGPAAPADHALAAQSRTCGPADSALAERLRVSAVDATPGVRLESTWPFMFHGSPIRMAARADGGSVVAWTAVDGRIHVTTLDAQDRRVGADVIARGNEVVGVVAEEDGFTLLSHRTSTAPAALGGAFGPDAAVHLTRYRGGQPVFDVKVIGDQPPATELPGSKWIDNSREGRLARWNDRYAVFVGHTQRWPDGIGHQGDLLRAYDAAGRRVVGEGWEWGCSHSLDLRLSTGSTYLATACLSDGYPAHGIGMSLVPEDGYVRHLVARADPETEFNNPRISLGGLVARGDDFWLSFVSNDGRPSSDVGVVRVAEDKGFPDPGDEFFRPGPVLWLTSSPAVHESGAHLASYGSEILASWDEGQRHMLAVLNGNAEVVEGPVVVAARHQPRDDLVALGNGDVGWAFADAQGADHLRIARVRPCLLPGTPTAAGTAATPTATATPTPTPTQAFATIRLPVVVRNMPKQRHVWSHGWSDGGTLPGYPVDVHTLGPDEAWAATGFAIFRWDGTTWRETALPERPASFHVTALDATTRDNAWAVGVVHDGSREVGAALRWDGDTWAWVEAAAPALAEAESYGFYDVRLSPQGEVLVRAGVCWTRVDGVCYQATAWLRYAGGVWTLDSAVPPEEVLALDVGPDDAPIGVGRYGVWAPRSGRWTLVADLPEMEGGVYVLTDVVSAADGGVWATTVTGHLFRWDGRSRALRQHPRPLDREMRDLHLCDATPEDLWAVSDDTPWHWNGARWSAFPASVPQLTAFGACHVRDMDHGWAIGRAAVGVPGSRLARYAPYPAEAP